MYVYLTGGLNTINCAFHFNVFVKFSALALLPNQQYQVETDVSKQSNLYDN